MESREGQQVVAHAQEQLGGLLLDHDADVSPHLERLSDDVVAEDAARPAKSAARASSASRSVVVLPAPFGPSSPKIDAAPNRES